MYLGTPKSNFPQVQLPSSPTFPKACKDIRKSLRPEVHQCTPPTQGCM